MKVQKNPELEKWVEMDNEEINNYSVQQGGNVSMSDKEFEARYGRKLPDPGTPRYGMLKLLAEIDRGSKEE